MYVSEICAEGIFVTFPWWLKNVKSRSKIALFWNERHFEIWFRLVAHFEFLHFAQVLWMGHPTIPYPLAPTSKVTPLARLASIFKSRTIISPILLSMIIWSSSSLRHVCNFLNVTLFCTAFILVFIPSHAYFVITHLTLLLMFLMVAWFSMTCISNVMTGSLTTFILNSLLAVLSSLAEFRSVVKDTKSNTKYFTKSISIHSDYQSVHFW